ncbi:MAG: CinA family protein [Sulfurovum sp.]|nr:CinA family protein [Sulfurovum sp.]
MNINYPNVEKIIQKLTSLNQTISFAESCTGGRIAASFTAVSGASNILNGSVVSYSNEIKHQWLGVHQNTLEIHGAVSSQCVEEMLLGIVNFASSNYAIAVSGIAGPTGGTDEKPVGTVYIGLQTPTSKEVFTCHFHGVREEIQEQSTAFAIEKLEEYLKI